MKAWLFFIFPLCPSFFVLLRVLNEAIRLRMNACTQDDGRDGLVEHCRMNACTQDDGRDGLVEHCTAQVEGRLGF